MGLRISHSTMRRGWMINWLMISRIREKLATEGENVRAKARGCPLVPSISQHFDTTCLRIHSNSKVAKCLCSKPRCGGNISRKFTLYWIRAKDDVLHIKSKSSPFFCDFSVKSTIVQTDLYSTQLNHPASHFPFFSFFTSLRWAQPSFSSG